METLLDEMKNLSSRVEKMEKLKKKEHDFVPSKSRTGLLSSITFKTELKGKVSTMFGPVSDSDSSRPTSPVDDGTGSGQPSPRRQVDFSPSSLEKSKSRSSERPVSKISSTLSEGISASDTPIEAEFAPCPETDDFETSFDEPDSNEAPMKSYEISHPKRSKRLATESAEILSSESRIPATRPPSPPPPPKNVKLPPPRNLIY